MQPTVFLYCRPGFEAECAAEMIEAARARGIEGFCKAKPATGYVVFQAHAPVTVEAWFDAVAWQTLIFTRQWFWVLTWHAELPLDDRATPLARAIAEGPAVIADVFIETPDSDDHKALSPLCQALRAPLTQRLRQLDALRDRSAWRAHVCFLATHAAYSGIAPVAASAPWRGGVPRLRFPAGAPSRSTLKLEEAFIAMLDEGERERWLQPGMSAVDLGAAPGGWTYQLVRRHLRVIAVDNGALAPSLLDSGLVEHRRADGFTFRPAQSVDWLVCDMVEQPIRSAELVARWVAQGWCRCAVVNLKLPMKKRYAEVVRCLARIREVVGAANRTLDLRAKQLYHDRDEVTVILLPDR